MQSISRVGSSDLGSSDFDNQQNSSNLSEEFAKSSADEKRSSGYCSYHDEPTENEDSNVSPTKEVLHRIGNLVNFYLSDFNLSRDLFLLKHVTKHREGFVSLKLLSNYKKIKKLTSDWRDVQLALHESSTLEISSDGTKVRRINPLPLELDSDFRHLKSFLAYDIPDSLATMDKLAKMFDQFGDMNSLRIHRPGGRNVPEINTLIISKPELSGSICAIVEYDKVSSARQALQSVADYCEFPIKVMDISRKQDLKKHDINYGPDEESSYFSSSEIEEAFSPLMRRKMFLGRFSSSSTMLSSPCGSPFPQHRRFKAFSSSDPADCKLLLNNRLAPTDPQETSFVSRPQTPQNSLWDRPQTPQDSLSSLPQKKFHQGLSSLLRRSVSNSLSKRIDPVGPSSWRNNAAEAPTSTPCSPWVRRHMTKLPVNNSHISDSCPNSPIGSPFPKRRTNSGTGDLRGTNRIVRNPLGPDGTSGFLSRNFN